MAQIIKEITLDVAKKNLIQAIVAKQNDSNSRFLKVTICNEGVKIDIPSTSSVILNAERADKESQRFMGEVNSDGTVTVPIAHWMLALDDIVRCSISVVDLDEQVLTTTSFSIEVEAVEYSDSDSDIPEDENYDVLIRLILDTTEFVELLKQRVENGEFDGADGVSPTVSVEKIDGGNRVTFTDTEGKKTFDVLDGVDYVLTDKDKQDIANLAVENAAEAAKKANEAAKDAQTLVDEITEKLKKGEFKGDSFTYEDFTPEQLAALKGQDGVSPTVSVEEIDGGNRVTFTDTEGKKSFDVLNGGSGQGGTVTYKIPKEYYQTDFGDDPNSDAIVMITINFGKGIFDLKQYWEDMQAGIIEVLPSNRRLSDEEQEIYKKYASFDIKPWVPTPRVSWFDLVTTEMLEEKGDGGYSRDTMFLNKIWNNDFKVLIHAENSKSETAYGYVKSDIIHSGGASLSVFCLLPFFGYKIENDEETGIRTYNLELIAMGAHMGYGSPGSYTSYVTNDDVKEVTITFIPNNTVVEEYEDE